MVVIVVGQIIFNLFYAKQVLISQNKSEVEQLFVKISNSYSDDEENLYELTKEEDSVDGFSIEIFSSEEIIYTSRVLPSFLFSGRFEKTLINSYEIDDFSQYPSANVVENESRDDSVIFLKGVIEYENEARYIVISKPVESIDNVIGIFTQSGIIISIGILIIGVVVIFVLTRQISMPIKNIEEVSKNLSNFDFSYYADEKSSIKEISSLAKSVNSMSKQLDNYMTEIKIANIKLTEDIEFQKKIETNRKQFIANISHEMKTPLSLLQLYCENLSGDLENIDKTDYVETIKDEVERLNIIVKDMLSVSSVENGLAKVRKEEMDFSDCAKNVVNTMYPLLENFNLVIDIQPQLHTFSDKKQIEEAMRNYINNAISHTKIGEMIKITVKREYHSIVFSVYNEGEKIREEDFENIWDSFYKSDKARTRKVLENAGLGLYIVKLICENHEGKYYAENKAKGVSFSFSLTTIS